MSYSQSLSMLLIPGIGSSTSIKILQSIEWKPNRYSDIEFKKFLKSSKFKKINEFEYYEKKALKKINELSDKGIHILNYFESDYPLFLKNIKNPPLNLYYKGNLNNFKKNNIAIIGSRKPSVLGSEKAFSTSSFLAKNSYNIVSGLALGCDTEGHKGALSENGKTLAVLPGSIDEIYPSSNTNLAEEILKNDGCLISEYLPGTKIINSNFIQRDRLQSAFSEFIVIIETKIDGGTMHTYNYAKEQKKIVSVFNFRENLSLLPTGNEHLINVENVFSFNNEEDLLNYLKSQVKNNQNISKQENLF